MAARGHKPVLALRDLLEPAAFLKDETYPILQGVAWTRPPPTAAGKPFSAATFADILAVGGFANAAELLAMLRACDSLIDVVKPDLVVAEYAPMLALAAKGRLPSLMFGTGFTVPPADLPVYPRLQPNVEPTMLQEKVLAVIEQVQKARRAPVPATLPEAIACDRRFPCTFPELDPYRAVRREAVIPPVTELPPRSPAPGAPRFFAYLASDAQGIAKVVSALTKSDVPGGIVLRQPSPQLREMIAKSKVTLYDGPQPMAEMMKIATVVIHHGGMGTTEACLAAGRPQMTVPRHLEQSMTARALRDAGIGFTINKDMPEEKIIEGIRSFAADKTLRERAASISAAIESRGARPGVAPIVDACEEMLGR